MIGEVKYFFYLVLYCLVYEEIVNAPADIGCSGAGDDMPPRINVSYFRVALAPDVDPVVGNPLIEVGSFLGVEADFSVVVFGAGEVDGMVSAVYVSGKDDFFSF